jgi:hypothetical protein
MDRQEGDLAGCRCDSELIGHLAAIWRNRNFRSWGGEVKENSQLTLIFGVLHLQK